MLVITKILEKPIIFHKFRLYYLDVTCAISNKYRRLFAKKACDSYVSFGFSWRPSYSMILC